MITKTVGFSTITNSYTKPQTLNPFTERVYALHIVLPNLGCLNLAKTENWFGAELASCSQQSVLPTYPAMRARPCYVGGKKTHSRFISLTWFRSYSRSLELSRRDGIMWSLACLVRE